jgi:hypothetical protein
MKWNVLFTGDVGRTPRRQARFTHFVATVLAGALSASAQFAIGWFTIDGGGGTSSGGPYTVSGTIGQPDAGRMSGGDFTLEGGFWGAAVAIQMPEAPLLTITRSGSNVIVSWPSPSIGFALQESASLGTPNWTAVGAAPTDNGATKSVTLPASAGDKFFRLIK